MTGYYPHAAQDFHIAGNMVLREIGRIITNLPLNIADHRAVNIKCAFHLNTKTFLNYAELMCRVILDLSHDSMHKMISCDAKRGIFKYKTCIATRRRLILINCTEALTADIAALFLIDKRANVQNIFGVLYNVIMLILIIIIQI